MNTPLNLAICGCGSRARTYSKIAMSLNGQFKITAGADPIASRVKDIANISNNLNFQHFASAEDILNQPKIADVMLIATQDQLHFGPAKEALKKGYHILLEKPAAQNIKEIRKLALTAKKHDRKIILCFVLRYTRFYSEVKKLVDSNKLGRIISMRAHEGVEAFHQAHSYVRGHWAKSAESTPMIIAKCCHDTDLISWLMNSRCKSVSSMGKLSYFTPENAPDGATKRCTDGCPVAETCLYSALRYTQDKKNWLNMVYPDPTKERTTDEVINWLQSSKWGRCVYHADNDVPDHQQVIMEFENGSTASLSMTAFDCGRTIEIYGTNASLRGGDAIKQEFGCDIVIRDHHNGELEKIDLNNKDDQEKSEYAGHGGGDYGLIKALPGIIADSNRSNSSLIENSIEGHLIGFSAEKSRLQGGALINLTSEL